MRRALWILLAAVVVAAVGVTAFLGMSRDATKIGVTQIVSHPGLDQVRQGLVARLAELGYRDGENVEIVFRNANGDPSLTLPIAQEFVRDAVDVMVPITTPSALAASKSTETIPIVFGGVTDPVGVGLVASLERPGKNITGTSDRWPFAEQLALFVRLLPGMKTIGMLYRPGDDVSSIALEALQELAPAHGLALAAQPVSSPGDVYATAVALFRNVDAIYTGMDNLVVENLDALLKAAREANKPVLGGDAGSVERGALAASAVDMEKLGRLTAEMVVDVLKGADPGSMPVRVLGQGDPVVNGEAATRFGVSQDLIKELGAEVL